MRTSISSRQPRCAGRLVSLTLPLFFCPASAWGQSGDVVLADHATVTRDVRAQEIDAMLAKYFRPGEPGAAIVISQHGSILFRKAYGLANTETNVPLRAELPLRTGSVTKQFTAAAIMLLAKQGKLSVSDEIGKYFPEYPGHDRHVTIEHLLTHTSGISSVPTFFRGERADLARNPDLNLLRVA